MAVSAALVCRSLAWTFCAVLSQSGQEVPNSGVPTFGTTVVASSGLRGDIYFVPPGIDALPSFKHLKPVGTIYANRLDIPPRDFKEGFPGITGRFEWFAIDYHGRFFIQARTRYQFGLSSDDGSKLYIDGHLAIDNDGIHAPSGCTAKVELGPGIHTIRISYLQGPGWLASLRLSSRRRVALGVPSTLENLLRPRTRRPGAMPAVRVVEERSANSQVGTAGRDSRTIRQASDTNAPDAWLGCPLRY